MTTKDTKKQKKLVDKFIKDNDIALNELAKSSNDTIITNR